MVKKLAIVINHQDFKIKKDNYQCEMESLHRYLYFCKFKITKMVIIKRGKRCFKNTFCLKHSFNLFLVCSAMSLL